MNSKTDFALDHLGIAVNSLKTAKAIYEKLGLALCAEETVEAEKVRVLMVPLEGTRIELLEPTSEDSVIARFIAKRGEGLHQGHGHSAQRDRCVRPRSAAGPGLCVG